MILTVLEHQKVYIGRKRRISKPQISYADAEALRTVDINNKGIFKWGSNYLIPQQWVGVISLPSLSIEILPKVADSYDESFIKETLLFMFKVAHDIPTKKNVQAKVEFSKNGLVEILISNYLNYVERYIQEGLLSSYNKVTRNLNTVKGSIDFSKQINKNILNSTRFMCRYSRLEIDNDINKLIKFTLHQMQRVTHDYSNISRIKRALIYFEDVSNILESKIYTLKIFINRINERVRVLADYSYMFLDGYSVGINSGKNTVVSMLFDMNKIFENFIYKYYRKIYGNKVKYQNSNNYLILDKEKSIRKINLKPDILIYSPTGFIIVLDTKWKIVKRFAKESDVYQMNAYITSIPGVNTAILMYPKTVESDAAVGDYEFLNNSEKKQLKIRTVDLSLIKDESKFISHLSGLLT